MARLYQPTALPFEEQNSQTRGELANFLKGLISGARPGNVQVVQDPPGLGKSHLTRTAILDRLSKDADLRRVLWVTREVRTENSLGVEAVQAFRGMA